MFDAAAILFGAHIWVLLLHVLFLTAYARNRRIAIMYTALGATMCLYVASVILLNPHWFLIPDEPLGYLSLIGFVFLLVGGGTWLASLPVVSALFK